MPRTSQLHSFFVAIIASLLSGCLAEPRQSYIGIAPIIDAVSVEQSSDRIYRIMNALSQDSAGRSYYDQVQAGFNYVDDRCMEYFSELFYLNRRREATKAGINAFGQTTNAVLAVSGASALSMAVVAQAFGLASSLTDIAAGTYLYQLPPATTFTFVRKLQGAYREAVAVKADQIRTQSTAYHVIQDYLALCLPPIIEAKLIAHVADVTATPALGGSISNIRIDVRSSAPIYDVRRPAARVERQIPPNGRYGGYSGRPNIDRIKRIQRSLCVARVDGVLNETTRAAIDEFFRGVQDGANTTTYPSVRREGLKGIHEDKLLQAERVVAGTCNIERDKGPFEIGRRVS